MTNNTWGNKYTDEELINALNDDAKKIIVDGKKAPSTIMNYMRGLFYLSPLGYLWDYNGYKTAWVAAGYLQKINNEE